MLWHDPLYGEWELPDFVEELIHTTEMARLRSITQDVLPNNILPRHMHSRFEHSLGVCFLAQQVLEGNSHLKNLKILLPVAALLHDAGSPPFSHLSEHFLKEIVGLDGEGFLEEMLKNTETERKLGKLGLTIEEVVSWVTGKAGPLGEVLHGSMDIDNIDNVTRYHLALNGRVTDFNPKNLAPEFSFWEGQWAIWAGLREEILKWQRLRREVYKYVYGSPHLNIATMVYRALEIAFLRGEINKSFFFLNDNQAFDKLFYCSNPATACLIEQAWRYNWYPEVTRIESYEPNKAFKEICAGWQGRRRLADIICQRFKISPEKICVYAGMGRDYRKITLPLRLGGSLRGLDQAGVDPTYRVIVYADEEVFNDRKKSGPRSLTLRDRIDVLVRSEIFDQGGKDKDEDEDGDINSE